MNVQDSVEDYVELMKEIFDFPLLKSLITGSANQPALKLVANAMHGGNKEGSRVYKHFQCFIHTCVARIFNFKVGRQIGFHTVGKYTVDHVHVIVIATMLEDDNKRFLIGFT